MTAPETVGTQTATTEETQGPQLTPEQAAQFGQIISELSEPLKQYATRLTGNPDDADDIVQEAFLKSMLKYDQFSDTTGDGIRPWLFRITHHCFIDRERKEGRERAQAHDLSDTEADTIPQELKTRTIWGMEMSNPEEVVTERLAAESRLDEVLTVLGGKNGRKGFVGSALVCLFMLDEGNSREEIAPIFGIAPKTVSTQKLRIQRDILAARDANLISA